MKPHLQLASMLAGLAFLAGVTPALADMSATSRAVWERHVAAATAGDIDAVMEDFTEESAIVTTGGVLAGHDAIRGFFEEFLAGGSAESNETVVVNAFVVHDDVVVFNFTIGAIGRSFHDTAIIRDGTIAVLTTVDYAAE